MVDRTKKTGVYAQVGVSHLWLVDPIARTLEVHRLEAGRWVVAANFGDTQRARAEPFDAVALDLSLWWLTESDPPAEP